LSVQIITTSTRPDLAEQSSAALLADWPEFVLRDRHADTLMPLAWRCFPEWDIRLLEDGVVAAGGWAVPLRWDGDPDSLPSGYDGALTAAIAAHQAEVAPDTMCVMAVAVRPDRQRSGLAGQVITALRDRAGQARVPRVVVPVRPTLKSRYPLTPMSRFAQWTRPDGLHLDPWIRTHQRLGARILCPAPRSMIVEGPVAQWQEWAGMPFPESGRYVVPGALDLVDIDTGRDLGSYAETNLWMRHA
jgi:GNAT superfamily N-acetyltransferase